ncbi:MAG TPA: hypothetical protein VID68_01120 [Solirubrobacteraceae bacterium]|jgi:hypothetical protein
MSADGTWNITVNSPLGEQESTVELRTDGTALTGEQSGDGQSGPIYDGKVDGDRVSWKVDVTHPMKLTIHFEGSVEGDSISGKAKAGMFPSMKFSGSRGA